MRMKVKSPEIGAEWMPLMMPSRPGCWGCWGDAIDLTVIKMVTDIYIYIYILLYIYICYYICYNIYIYILYGVPEMGIPRIPLNHPFLFGIFFYKPSSYWGSG